MDLSGQTLPNKYMASLLEALDELMGTNGLHALLNASGLNPWTANPPPNDEEREIDFSQVAALTRTMVDLYGEKGAQSLLRPANYQVFKDILADDPGFEYSEDASFEALDPMTRVHRVLTTCSEILSSTSDLTWSLEPGEERLKLVVDKCPFCWASEKSTSSCIGIIGFFESAIRIFVKGEKFSIHEIECASSGGSHCIFEIAM